MKLWVIEIFDGKKFKPHIELVSATKREAVERVKRYKEVGYNKVMRVAKYTRMSVG